MATQTNAPGGRGGREAVLAVVCLVPLALCAGITYGVLVGGGDPCTGSKSTPACASAIGSAEDPEAKTQAVGLASREGRSEGILPLEPLIVSLEGGARWLRIEGSITFDKLPPDGQRAVLLQQIGEDMTLYLRATPITQIESAAGMELVREDLSDLVRIRTGIRAARFVLKSLVVE
jgi:hypothetical protein